MIIALILTVGLLNSVAIPSAAATPISQNPFLQQPAQTPPTSSTTKASFIKEERARFIPVRYGDATRIQFSNGISFDTRNLGKSGEPDLPQELTYKQGESPYYIIQFSGPIYKEQQNWLKNNGIKTHFVVPRYGFICTIDDPARLTQLKSNPAVKWFGLYQPAYKVSRLFDQVGENHKATILLFLDADINAVLNQIKAITKSNEFITSDNGINKIIQGVIDKSSINKIARIPGVYWIEPYIQPKLHNNNVQWIVQDAQSNVRNIWDKGIHGEGEIVNTCDSGINTSHYQHRSGSSPITTWGYYPTHNAIVAYDSGAPSNIVFGDGSGASYHGTHTGCTLTGDDSPLGSSNRDGVALKSKLYFNDCGDNSSSSIYIFPDLNDLYIRPYNKYYPPTRAHISSNSWGANTAGAYTANCLQVDQFMWGHKDFLLFFSSGNSAVSGSVGSPASAKNVVTVGGCLNGSSYRRYYSSTSRGPTQDGRLKPTIVAPAQYVYSATSGTSNYSGMGGTSMASPGAAGAATLVRQYLREGWYPSGKKTAGDEFNYISASLLKAILINCADPDVSSTGNPPWYTIPSMRIGWGRVDLDSTLYFAGEARKTLLVDDTVGVLTGERVDYHFNLPSGAQNLKITLVWTDYPGNPAAQLQIVNDLDLSAYIGNTYYRGNQYSNSQSVPNPSGRDSINVEECIRVDSPTSGDWLVSIEGRNVPVGPQPFSLVITYNAGSVAGVVMLDKPVYRANDFVIDTVRVRVEDPNYGSAGSVDQVMVEFKGSLIETQPETLWCTEYGDSAYVFGGQFSLLFGKAVHGDGKLSVCQGDTIWVSYIDNNPSYTSTTWAGVDAEYFMISNVHAENIQAVSAEICWTTNDNANSKVYYGTNPNNLNQTAGADTPYVTPHRVRLSGLTPNSLYYYDVESRDFRGNVVKDNNGGQHYTFTTSAGGGGTDVLVVVLNNNLEGEEFAHPDFLADALDAGGWTYNWWSTKDDGQFTRDQLKWYKAVYFQVGQENYPPWTVAQKETIKLYHNGGARFAMTGHDIGWSPWQYTPEADTIFCKNQLHFRYIGDITSTSWTTLRGISGDPISGSYTSGVPYQPFRSGAAGDSIRLSGTGAPGTGTYVWHGNSANDSCGVKWESQNNMGTPGDGIWGGHKTRVVTNAFEITQIDTSNPNSATRSDILNKLFIWLIGHDHPDVTISSPVGGNTYTSSPITISWTAQAYGGASIDTTWIKYSPDGGQTWFLITSGTNITSPYSWDVSSLTNGPHYRVKVTVCDKDVYPSMKGSDQTTDFTISIAGNDYTGPKVLPQSIIVGQNPMIVTPSNTSMPFQATVDDSLTGLSNIMAAEWSYGGSPASPGTGFPMFALDGSFNEIQEVVAETLYFIYAPGNTEVCTLWVRGEDVANNWGNALMRTFTIIDGVISEPGISESGKAIPLHFALSAPMPNPFSNAVAIQYAVPRTKKVTLKVYNCLGQVVKTLVDNTVKPGFYKVYWDGTDDQNRSVSAGIYFYQLTTDEYTSTKKTVMIK